MHGTGHFHFDILWMGVGVKDQKRKKIIIEIKYKM